MEGIIQNPGLQHIVTNTLMFLDKRSIAAFQSVNQECKRIANCPRFFIRKLSQETSQKDVIDNWKALIQKIPEDEEEMEQNLTLQLFKMCGKQGAKHPLDLARELARNKKEVDDKLAMFIIENSHPKTFIKFNHFGNLTPMHVAAVTGYVQSATRMINNSILPNVANDDGYTPMHLAAYMNQVGMVQLLMAHSENPNASTNKGITPIHVAAFNLEIVRLLMTSTNNSNVASNDGLTPIHWAAYKGHLEVVRLLMTSTNNPNAPDNFGRTPEHLASQYIMTQWNC